MLDGSNTFDRVHLFIRDRTRSIRQDFAIQHTSDSITISCHERIARFHVVALHEMRSAPVREDASHEVYSEQQEVEQLNKSKLTNRLLLLTIILNGLTMHSPDKPYASL